MSAAVYKMSIDQGSRKTYKITYKDSLGVAKDLTGYACRGQVKAKATDTTALMSFDCLIPTPANGEIFIYVNPTKTALIPVRGKSYSEKTTLYYDVELYSLSETEDVIRILNGEFVLSPEQTKSAT